MSALVDDNTIAVTYDHKRGEDRSKWTREDTAAKREAVAAGVSFSRAETRGDCVDCHQCVTVCPTGIDIRNGIQLECVNCTACMDACDDVMEKVGLPTGLVRYTSLNAIEQGRSSWFTNRIKAYGAIWLVLMSVVITLFVLRSDLDVMILRQEGTTWVEMGDRIGNFYRIQVINKGSESLPLTLHIEQPSTAVLQPIALPAEVESQQIEKGRFLLSLPRDVIQAQQNSITINVVSNGTVIKRITTSFVGP
jgi:cytochrome c oxidase accessory protein FixG